MTLLKREIRGQATLNLANWHSMGASMTAFGDVLADLRLPKQIKVHLKHHALWSRWEEVVGPELARVTMPREIKGKTLVVNVVHQAWAHQLHFLTPSILNKIRIVCPSSAIKDLHYTIGLVSAVPAKPKADEISEKPVPARLSELQEMTLRAVHNDDLRRSIRMAMEAAARRKR